MMQKLSRLRTLRGIVDWITNRNCPPPAAPAQTTQLQPARRYLVDAVTLPPLGGPPDASLIGRRIAIVGDGAGIALELSVLLERRGGEVRLLNPDQPMEVTRTDSLIYLAALDRGRAPV